MNINQDQNLTERIRDIPFTQKEVDIIISCATWMKLIGYVSRTISILCWIIGSSFMLNGLMPKGNKNNIVEGFIFILFAFIPFFMGKWVNHSSRAFKDVINTTMDDQGFLVEGFHYLQKYFLILGIFFISIISILILALIFWSVTSIQPASLN